MTTLHDQLRARLGPDPDALVDRSPLQAALWAVVELHAPELDRHGCCLFCKGCETEGWSENWPCPTIRAIARELGMEAS